MSCSRRTTVHTASRTTGVSPVSQTRPPAVGTRFKTGLFDGRLTTSAATGSAGATVATDTAIDVTSSIGFATDVSRAEIGLGEGLALALLVARGCP